MSLFKKKDKSKDKESALPDLKPAKAKKVKIHDIWDACAHGTLEGLEKVLKKKNGMSQINQPNEEGRWPIHIATGGGHVDLVEMLLANGAQCNMIENTEARWNVLHWAVNSRNFQMMKLIASQPTLKPDFRGPASGTSRMDRNSPLHHYARMLEEDPEGVIPIIVQQRGGNVNAVNSQGETPLHVACTYKHISIAMELLANGANPNAQNDHGETPLHLGARYGPEGMIKLLLKCGGNPAIVGANGTPHDVSTSVAVRKLLSSALSSSKAASTSASSSSSSTVPPAPSSTRSDSHVANGTSHAAVERAPSRSTLIVDSTSSTASGDVRGISKTYHWTVDFAEISIGPQIGSGGFGIVYKGAWRGIDVAVKCLKREVDEDELGVFLHEVNTMSRLRHQNILLFVGACLDEPHICFLTEYIPHGNLRHVLDQERLLPLKKLNMAIEAARGLAYLHSQSPAVLHRDLKSANVLVDDNYHIKLADFGLSRAASIHTGEVGSHHTIAELLERATAARTGQPGNATTTSTSTNNSNGDSSTAANAGESSPPTKSISNSNNSKSAIANSNHFKKDASTSTGDAATASTTHNISTNGGNHGNNLNTKNGAATDGSGSDTAAYEGSSCCEARKTTSSTASAPNANQPGYLDLLDQAGTLYTTAPEVLNGAEYTKEADIYALGIIFWELATEKIPYEGLSHLQLVREIVEHSLPVPTEMGSSFGSLIQDMLSKDPIARPTLSQIQERLKACRAQLGESR